MTRLPSLSPDKPAPQRAHAFTFQRGDVLAGITVFLIALPLCLGIATASGVEPFAGILSGIIAGLVVALLSGSRLSVSGPAAGLVVIVAQALATLGSFSAFLCALLIAGAIQIGLGAIRAGKLASYVPTPVIHGMLASIGILLIVSQLPLTLGLSNGAPSWLVMGLALASFAILLVWDTRALRRFAWVRAVPAPLAVVAMGIGATALLGAFAPDGSLPQAQRVDLPAIGSFGMLSAVLDAPDLTQIFNPAVWRVAVVLAIVASLETLLSIEALEKIDPAHQKVPPDRELKAQGVGNMLAALVGALPITAVVVRSAANVQAGGRSRLSCVVHALALVVSVVAFTQIINMIPLACLAAILVHTGYKLAKPQLFISMGRAGCSQWLPFIATVAGVLATDLLIGILIGFGVSVVLVVKRNIGRVLTLTRDGDHYLLTVRKSATFFCMPRLKDYLGQIPTGATLIFDATHADHIDHDVREVVASYTAAATANGIRVDFKHWPAH